MVETRAYKAIRTRINKPLHKTFPFSCYASALVFLVFHCHCKRKLHKGQKYKKCSEIFDVHFVYFDFKAFEMLPKFPAFVAGNVAWNTRIRAFTHAQTKFPPVSTLTTDISCDIYRSYNKSLASRY